MAFTFVHTADWQIGKAFGRFPVEVAARLRAARLAAIDRIADVASAAGAEDVLVAGDVIDSELIDDAGLRQPLSRMAHHRLLRWHLLPGNHDPARRGGVWERMARLGLPPNVRPCLEPAVMLIAPHVALLPAPLFAKEMRTDPTQWMEGARTAGGVIRIGLAHGSVQGFGSLGEAAVPIAPGRRAGAALDYLALGDWHGTRNIAPGVWYSGTPEPDSFLDNEAGQALVVSIAGAGAPPQVRPVATGACRWLERRVVLDRLADIEPVLAEVAGLGPAQAGLVLSLVIEGSIGAGEAAGLDERLAQLAGGLLVLDGDRGRLRVRIAEDDVARFADPALAAVAGRLKRRQEEVSGGEARAAARAMSILLALADGEAAPREEHR